MHIILEHSLTVYKHRTFHPHSLVKHSLVKLSTSIKILVLQDHCGTSNPAVLQQVMGPVAQA